MKDGNLACCKECIDWFYLDDEECIQCNACISGGKIKWCVDGFLLTDDGCTQKCSSNCAKFEGAADHYSSCSNCYALVGNFVCRRCLADDCETCEEGDATCGACNDDI